VFNCPAAIRPTPLAEFTIVALREFFSKYKKGGSRRTTYKTVNAFFNWACKYGYLAANPLGPIDTKNEIGDFGVNAEYCRLLTNSA
jgi:hypothetical protein